MVKLKEYGNLYGLYRRGIRRLKIPFFICLLIFFLAFVALFFDIFPFEVELAMMGMIFPAILFGLLWLIFGIRTRKLLKSFSAFQLNVMNREAAGCKMCEGLLVTTHAVIRARSGLDFVPLANVLWVYVNVTIDKLEGLIPIWKSTLLIFAGRDHKWRSFRIKNNQKAYDFIQIELLQHRQDIVFGYNENLEVMYRNDIKQMIDLSLNYAEERKKEMEIIKQIGMGRDA